MQFTETKLRGSYLIDTIPFRDERGSFARYFCQEEFASIGFDKTFVQFNHSINTHKGTLRGMHFQKSPGCETKFIKCIRGAVLDVFVDIRLGSPTFLQHVSVELTAQNMRGVLIPEGFAHGFQTLEEHSELIYHHTEFYNPSVEAGLRYDDPSLQISWPLGPTYMSEKDKNYPLIDDHFKGIEI